MLGKFPFQLIKSIGYSNTDTDFLIQTPAHNAAGTEQTGMSLSTALNDVYSLWKAIILSFFQIGNFMLTSIFCALKKLSITSFGNFSPFGMTSSEIIPFVLYHEGY